MHGWNACDNDSEACEWFEIEMEMFRCRRLQGFEFAQKQITSIDHSNSVLMWFETIKYVLYATG